MTDLPTEDTPARTATLDELVAALAGDVPPPGIDEPMPDLDDADARARERSGLDLADNLPMEGDDDLTGIEGEASPQLVSIVESLLFAAERPIGVRELRKILKEPSKRQIQLALLQLRRDLAGRGVVLAQVAGGFRLRTNPENARWVQDMLAVKPARLSRSQLEALAVVAYRQPITKAEIDHVRGVDCSAVLKILLEHDLAKIVGRKDEPGRPLLYGTTVKFLEFFNLRSLRDMPQLHEFSELTDENEALVRETLGDEPDVREVFGQERLGFAPTPEAAVADDQRAESSDEVQ
jgi:segregation and condensation protein B